MKGRVYQVKHISQSALNTVSTYTRAVFQSSGLAKPELELANLVSAKFDACAAYVRE